MDDNICHVFGSNLPGRPFSASPEFCIHASRHYVTHTNVVVTVVEHHRFTETVQSEFRCVVCGASRKRILSSETADVDHVTTAALAHQRQGFAATIENAAEVRV